MRDHVPSVRNAFLLTVASLLLMIFGFALAARVQAGPNIRLNAVFFQGASGAWMRALLYRPSQATAAHPAPAILAVHGYLNTAEMQGNFATEYARRGYVVLAPDQRGHGFSDPAAFADGFGGPDALAYLRGLAFVDQDNIGLSGHSMGGWTVLAAAAAFPDGYKAMVLEGSSVGAPFAPEGTTDFPRNLMVVFGTRDEFGGFMWGKSAPLHTGATQKAMALFGTDGPIVPGRLYGDIAGGSARMLVTPATTHAWLHQSRAGIGAALDWFGRTLAGGKPIDPDDQIWPWREAGSALALIAFPGFLLGVFALLLGTPLFRALRQPISTPARPMTAKTGIGLLAFAVIPALDYLPLMALAERLIGENAILRQSFSNQIAFWAIVNAALAVIAGRFAPGLGQASPVRGGWRAFALAFLVILAGMAVVGFADRLGHIDPRWWIIALRPLNLERARDFLVYLPAFLVFATVTLQALDRLMPLDRGPFAKTGLTAFLALAGGFILLLLGQYGFLAMTGALFHASEGLRIIIAINFVPLFAAIAVLGCVTRRWTGSLLPGGLLAGLLACWYLTATQPIGV